MKNNFLLLIAVLPATIVPLPNTYAGRVGDHLYNGSFEKIQKISPTDKRIAAREKKGWKFSRPVVWPSQWNPSPAVGGKGSTLVVVTDGAHLGHRFIRIGPGHVATSYGKVKKGVPYIVTLWVRGKGRLKAGLYRYGSSKYLGIKWQLSVNVDTGEWVQYRGLFRNDNPDVKLVTIVLSATSREPLDIDDVDFAPATPAEAMMVEELSKLYGSGALIENMNVVQADEAFAGRQAEYKSALKEFRDKSASLDKKLLESLKKEIKALDPYVLTKGLTVIQTSYYNQMIAVTRVLNRLASGGVGAVIPVKVKAVEVRKSAVYHKPGLRSARPKTVTITEIKPDYILYKENDKAGVKATIINKTATAKKGTLIALMHLDLDTVREIKREPVSIAPRGKKIWRFNYNVGPETYGRGIEVRFVDENGKMIDKWQEFYLVAAEWHRVHMQQMGGRYENIRIYHASEPTDFGVHSTNAEVYLSGQVRYRINQPARLRQIASYNKKRINQVFYQNRAFCGIMGYEDVRKHPEYVIYDENGQFAVDPVYGGYPNPMELASPIEVGPKRKNLKIKPYLDRQSSTWQHVDANFAREDVIEYMANCIKKYAREQGFNGVYFDGTPGVIKGYGYDGKLNVPLDDERKIARLNARILRIYQGTLKKDNPNFGTWCNFSYYYVERFRRLGRTQLIGSGMGGVSDEAIKELTVWKNVMCLMEQQGAFGGGEGLDCYPAKLLPLLIKNRDYLVQKYGANVIVGYVGIPIDREKPGLSKWGWPTINYYMAIITATQHHLVTWKMPSFDPGFQFLARYSRFLWARDIKAVPVEKVDKIIQLKTPEKIWWKRLVYKRKREDGYDLIVHLVRIPPTKKWDINWVDEPMPLKGVEITADIGSASLQTAQACRPYYYEEKQQPVRKTLKASTNTGKVAVEVPPFRYYTMLVFRVKTGKQ